MAGVLTGAPGAAERAEGFTFSTRVGADGACGEGLERICTGGPGGVGGGIGLKTGVGIRTGGTPRVGAGTFMGFLARAGEASEARGGVGTAA